MPKIVEVPGVGNVEFPDTMDDQSISAAIRKQRAPQSAQPAQSGGPPPMPRDPRAALGNAVVDAVRNAPQSGMNFLKNITAPIHSPRRTFDAITGTVEGGLNRGAQWLAGTLGMPGQLSADEESQGKKFNAVVGDYKQAYGSPQQALQTFAKDPFRVAADVSMATGGAAPVARALGMPRAASALNTASQASNPAIAVPRMVKNAVPAATRDVWARRLYQSGLKPPTGMLSEADERVMLEAAMDEKIPLPFIGTSEKALIQTRGKIDAIDATAKGTISAGAAAGKTVDPMKVAGYTSRSITKFADQANPVGDLKAIGDSTKEFLDVHGKKTGAPIPVDKAQKIKQGTYSKLRDSYGELTGAAKEAQKDLARGLKEEVYAQFPELRELGKKEKSLIDLEESLERFAKRQGNRDMVGIGTPIAATAYGGAAGLLKAAIDNPGIKSRIAIALRAGTRTKRQAARGRQTANAAGRIADAAEQPQEQ